ncbi:MAG: exodeoxyribonuclease VII large subunit, partial [Planctomycetota bacterium]
WAFNERVVAEAIVRCPRPVVAAIGHETDVTIAELVADLRCATPTQAAVRLTPDRVALSEEWSFTRRRLERSCSRLLARGRERVARIEARPTVRDASRLISPASERIERSANALRSAMRAGLVSEARRLAVAEARLQRAPRTRASRGGVRLGAAASRLEHAIRRRLEPTGWSSRARALDRAMGACRARASERLASRARELEAVSPLATIRRGFTITLDDKGRALRSAASVAPGQRIRTVFADGEVDSRADAEGGRMGDQMDLFGGGG